MSWFLPQENIHYQVPFLQLPNYVRHHARQLITNCSLTRPLHNRGFDLYAVFDPLIAKSQAKLLGNKLIRWINVSAVEWNLKSHTVQELLTVTRIDTAVKNNRMPVLIGASLRCVLKRALYLF